MTTQQSCENETLLSLLEKERGYYEAIYDITYEEGDKLQRQRPLNEVMALLKKKQILVACVDELQRSIAPLKEQWMHDKDADPLSDEIQNTIRELNGLLKKTLDLDKKNQRRLQQHLTSLKSQASAGRS